MSCSQSTKTNCNGFLCNCIFVYWGNVTGSGRVRSLHMLLLKCQRSWTSPHFQFWFVSTSSINSIWPWFFIRLICYTSFKVTWSSHKHCGIADLFSYFLLQINQAYHNNPVKFSSGSYQDWLVEKIKNTSPPVLTVYEDGNRIQTFSYILHRNLKYSLRFF